MKKARGIRKKVITGLIGVICGGLILFTVVSRLTQPEKQKEEILTPVVVSGAIKGSISRKLYYSGTLIPQNTVIIISKVAGKIEKIFVKKGDLVTKDQTLVKIEDNTVNLQKQQAYSYLKIAEAQYQKAQKGLREEEKENARALVKQAEEDLLLAEENFERMSNLYESGAISKSEYDDAENMLRSARTSVENAKRTLKLMEQGASDEEIEIARANAAAARAQFDLAKLQVDFTKLETPVFGIVADIMADEGNLVGTSTPILAIVQINPIRAKIPIPEQYYGEFINNGDAMSIIIFPNAYPGSGGFKADIASIGPTIDPLSRTFALDIEILNPVRKLRPGMYVNVEITLEVHDNTLLLPVSSIVMRDGKKVIFTVEHNSPGSVVQHEIKTGIVNEEFAEVVDGIPEQARIITEGNLFLEDGQRVKVIEER
ncbi:MAG: efflux RND transporter periplasmic adaptor subunit [Spirochaetales bacterium]|nr:efflux RND transporter periplasmic adaptor subunit [Spirochaetales bacterium]